MRRQRGAFFLAAAPPECTPRIDGSEMVDARWVVPSQAVDEADGTVRVRSKGIAVMASGAAGTVVYEDIVEHTSAGWRIAVRKVVGGP